MYYRVRGDTRAPKETVDSLQSDEGLQEAGTVFSTQRWELNADESVA